MMVKMIYVENNPNNAGATVYGDYNDFFDVIKSETTSQENFGIIVGKSCLFVPAHEEIALDLLQRYEDTDDWWEKDSGW